MKKKKGQSVGSTIAAITAAIVLASGSGMISPAAATYVPQEITKESKKDQTNRSPEKVRPSAQQSKRIEAGGFANPFGTPGLFKNQRQYRKWMRQVPHMKCSSKCRIKKTR